MGSCFSCLGLGPRGSDIENPETSRLLCDEPYSSQYGSNIQNPQRSAYQPDPGSLRRQREALESICHSMSDDVVDVFTVVSSTASEANLNRQISPFPLVKRSPEPELAPDETIYKTISRGRGGPIASPLKKDRGGWQATKAIMG